MSFKQLQNFVNHFKKCADNVGRWDLTMLSN